MAPQGQRPGAAVVAEFRAAVTHELAQLLQVSRRSSWAKSNRSNLPVAPASLWQRPDTTDALRSRDMRRLFHLLRQYAGASQTCIGIACGLTQGKVSSIMSGSHRVTTLEVFERIAGGLGMPLQARLALG